MDASDQRKLCMQGFTIIRRMDTPKPHIKYKSKDNPDNWKKFMGGFYLSKAARDRTMKALKEKSNYVED